MIHRVDSKKLVLALLPLLLIAGCSKSGPARKDIWGSVTWNGQKVPEGAVTFEPNSAKGNRGPMGFAAIENGKFDTRSIPSFKGCLPGSHKVLIVGGDGRNKTPDRPYGNDLFPAYSQEIEIPKEGGELNFTVPDRGVSSGKKRVENRSSANSLAIQDSK